MFCWPVAKESKRERLSLPLSVVWEQRHPLIICIILFCRHTATNDLASISNKMFHVSQVETDVCYNVSLFLH